MEWEGSLLVNSCNSFFFSYSICFAIRPHIIDKIVGYYNLHWYLWSLCSTFPHVIFILHKTEHHEAEYFEIKESLKNYFPQSLI